MKRFIYLCLSARLKYGHSAGVVNRALRPRNILIGENCDFGLARVQHQHMTGYVTIPYYRAPGIMLTWQKYNIEVDIWSASCIFAEMMEGNWYFLKKTTFIQVPAWGFSVAMKKEEEDDLVCDRGL